MAEAGISLEASVDRFSCPICLDLLKDPVTTSCGHSFCKECINGYWDQDHRRTYSCPQCRKTFSPRPDLCRNTMLTEVVEKLKETEVQAALSAHCYAGPGDVECDFCTERKRKAIKSCLMCLTSFCETHLKPHSERPALKKHTLVEPCGDLQEKICSQHDEVIKIYCRTDGSFICYLCMMEEHKGHDTVTAKAERSEKERELKEEQRRSQQRIQEKQKKVEELKQAVIHIKGCAHAAVENSELLFGEMISTMERNRSKATELIRDREKTELSRAEELLQQVEQEIVDLQSRVTELEELSQIHNHIQFLQSFPSSSASYEVADSPTFSISLSFDGLINTISDLKIHIQEIFNKIPSDASADPTILPPEPKTREDFLQYFRELTLDPNTVHPRLVLSENNRVATFSKRTQSYPDHPERFDSCIQVLCKESVSGRCYWEVERSGDVGISLSFKEISRKGDGHESRFGNNSLSCNLWCSTALYICHNNAATKLADPPCSRIGVYVDHSTGTLSFYSVSDGMKLLYRDQMIFTQPLYLGFEVYGAVRLFDQKNVF